MHSTPTDEEKLSYIYSGRSLILSLGLASSFCLLCGGLLFAKSHEVFLVYGLYVLFTGLYLFLSYLVGVLGRDFDYKEFVVLQYVGTGDPSPAIDVFLPVCGEDFSIIEASATAISRLNYDGKLHFHMLDDGADPQIENLAKSLGFNYINRPEKTMKKAGNVRYAYAKTQSPIFAIFDADFQPRPDFLRETVKYFRNKNIAIVQTPQFFRVSDHTTVIGKGAAFIQELFYRLIQVSRDTFRASICVGTCALYRRSAFQDLGGTYPIEYSEDVHTGFYATSKGFRVKYVPVALSKGLCPETHRAFFTQQYRWAMGSFSLFLKRWFWVTPLTAMQRICYLTGMLYYISTGIGVLLAPLPSILMLNFFPRHIFYWNYLFSLPSFIFMNFIWARWSTHPWGLYALATRQIQYWAHLWAICDRLTGNLMPWTPTGAISGNSQKFTSYKRLSLIWTIVCFLAVIVPIVSHEWSWHFALPLFFSTFWTSISLWAWSQK